MSSFVRLPWAHVWTLNVDDCLERAYDEQGRYARQQPLSISWTERHRTPRHGLDEVLIVHLHGKASRAQRDGELVFDISTYLHAAQANHRWHTLFGDYFPSKPFLILGASLDEEIDLQGILEQGRLKSLDHPSIIVNRTVTQLQAEEYRDFGLLPVAATAEQFFAAVEADLPAFLEELTASESTALADVSQEALTFMSQWQSLEDNASLKSDVRHDIYVGHEPEWPDAVHGKVVTRGIEKQITELLTKQIGSGDSRVVFLRGGVFSGKTAVLLSSGLALVRNGYRVFMHNGDSAPDVDAVIWWFRHYPKTILLMDDAFDFTLDVRTVVEEAELAGVSPRFCLTERSARASGSDRDLDNVQVEGRKLSETLSDTEIKRFIDKLTENRRLGEMTGMNGRQQTQYFERHGRQLFSAMAGLERGRGFEARVKEEFASVLVTEQRTLMGVAALASSLGYGLPVTVAPRATGLSVAGVEDVVSAGALADFLHIRRGLISPRHRIFGSLLVETCLTSAERYDYALRLATAVAPHVSPAAIGARSMYYLIARSLMGQRFMSGLLDQNFTRVLEWYAEIQPAYDWNARYWEQRALAASNAGQFEPAYSWARQAVQVRADSYTLNTVGTVLMRRALSEATDVHWPTDSFEAAEAALREARSLEADKSEYPFETFFSYTVRLVEIVKRRDVALTEQLRNLWNQWYIECLTLDRVSQQRLRSTLESVQPRWERATSLGATA
jgi:hypothetical protein